MHFIYDSRNSMVLLEHEAGDVPDVSTIVEILWFS